MGKSVLQVRRADAAEIKKLLASNESFTIGGRLYLVYLVALGYSSRKLAETHGISFKQITTYVHRFDKEGVEGLKNKTGQGRRTNLKPEQIAQVREVILSSSPEKQGLEAARWTGPLISRWIKNQFGIDYQKAQVYVLLQKAGIEFRPKKGLVETN